MKILVATYPFGEFNRQPLDLLEATGWEIVLNPHHHRLKQGEVDQLLEGIDGVIAGTEPYPAEIVARHADHLKIIARVGIGLDNVDPEAFANSGVAVTYTPEAPSQAVAELTVAQMLNLIRYIPASDRSVRELAWNRLTGWLLSELKVGILGLGRIGKIVVRLLQPFGAEILACDTSPDLAFAAKYGVRLVGPDELFFASDLLSVHIPMDATNRQFVNRRRLGLMKTGSFLINTSRGPVLDEEALLDALLQKHLGGAALDVFQKEPYEGPLSRLETVVLTSHMGASARKCRFDMEYQAAEDCVRYLKGEAPLRAAPGSYRRADPRLELEPELVAAA